MNRHQEAGGQRNHHAVQHVEAQQRRGADGPAAYEREAGVVTRVDQRTSPSFTRPDMGPSFPAPGVARAMFEPTVIAQIAS